METVIDLEIPTHEPVLVLNGVLDTDSSIKVSVSHSSGAFDNANPSLLEMQMHYYLKMIFLWIH